MQFNDYHKYTVDEHSIRAVEAATTFQEIDGPLGEAYAGIRSKRTLHLALLVHDLGKGFDEDHSEVGRRLAALARGSQGLVVTHLPQVACLGNRHFRIDKRTAAGRTFTAIEPIEGGARIEEIARMGAGLEVTEAAKKHAAEMLEAGKRKTSRRASAKRHKAAPR